MAVTSQHMHTAVGPEKNNNLAATVNTARRVGLRSLCLQGMQALQESSERPLERQHVSRKARVSQPVQSQSHWSSTASAQMPVVIGGEASNERVWLPRLSKLWG